MLSEIENSIGVKNVLCEAQATELYPCPSQSGTSVKAVLKPQDVQHVQEIVKWANKHKIALYPLSTGKNWGYGGGSPVEEDCGFCRKH